MRKVKCGLQDVGSCGTVGKMRSANICRMSAIICPRRHSLFILMAVSSALAVRPSCPEFPVGQLCYYLSKVWHKKTLK